MIYIFDIDGTLADISHRLEFIQHEPKDWRKFFAACDDDDPIWPVIHTLDALHDHGHVILLISGRSDEVRYKTADWMRNHNVRYHEMYMRKEGDHREDSVVKAELLEKAKTDWKAFGIAGVFEDRKQVVDMYRSKGLRVFQVADGNF
jgi:phosphoglycolate phosphatase-like HAD superfamily hydrolase